MVHSSGGLPPKLHALVDADGRPLRLRLALGQAGAAPVGTTFAEGLNRGATLIADPAGDAHPIRDAAAARKVWACIPPRVIRKGAFNFSPRVCRRRNLDGKFCSLVKKLRGLAARKRASIRICIAGS